jgi:quercetin dioxygenase-like cupin family protein
MSAAYTYFADLAREAVPPPDGILSRTLYQDDHLKAVLFGFAAGQELSEHTAARPAVMHVVSGEATFDLGDSRQEARAGTWVHMPPGLKHGIQAKTPLVLLLLLLR